MKQQVYFSILVEETDLEEKFVNQPIYQSSDISDQTSKTEKTAKGRL